MSTVYQWARHPGGIERIRDNCTPAVIHQALAWAVVHHDPAGDEVADALTTVFMGEGYVGGDSMNRAIEILLDAYLEHILEDAPEMKEAV